MCLLCAIPSKKSPSNVSKKIHFFSDNQQLLYYGAILSSDKQKISNKQEFPAHVRYSFQP